MSPGVGRWGMLKQTTAEISEIDSRNEGWCLKYGKTRYLSISEVKCSYMNSCNSPGMRFRSTVYTQMSCAIRDILGIRALRALISLNGHDQPHLWSPPHPWALELYLSSTWGHLVFLLRCLRRLVVSSFPISFLLVVLGLGFHVS